MNKDQNQVKHSPGPWLSHSRTLSDNTLVVTAPHEGGYERVCTLRDSDDRDYSPDDYRAQANARLIAAAPELLAAMKNLFEQCAMIHKHWGDGSNQRQADAAIKAARAAIAKAEGR